MTTPALLRAYRATSYQVQGIEIRIGRRSAGLDGLLRASGYRQAALLTAFNPRSRRMPPGWNQGQQARLVQFLRRVKWAQAAGIWRRWSEEHVLVFEDPRKTMVLARRFRQNAIVAMQRNRPVRLLLLDW